MEIWLKTTIKHPLGDSSPCLPQKRSQNPFAESLAAEAHTSIFGCPLVFHITSLLSETSAEEILKLSKSTYIAQYSISHKTMH